MNPFQGLPTNPEHRRIVISIGNLKEYASKLNYIPNRYEKGIVVVESNQIVHNQLGIVFNEGEARQEGAVFIQSPFDYGQYEILSKSRYAFALQKAQLTSVFCQHLGATSYKASVTWYLASKEKNDATLKGGTGTVTGGASLESQMDKKFTDSFYMDHKSPGCAPDLDLAQKCLVQNHLENERELAGLLTKMSNKQNPIEESTLKFNLVNEVNQRIKLGVDVHFTGALSRLGGSFARETSEELRAEYEVQVHFPKKKAKR